MSSSRSQVRRNDIEPSKTVIKNHLLEVSAKAHRNEQSTITKCDEIMTRFLTRRAICKPPCIRWIEKDHVIDNVEYEENEKLYKDVLTLVDILELSVGAQRITATSGRQNRELTAILGNILLICSETPPVRLTGSILPNTSDTCMRVLNLIKSLNFDIQPIHLQFTVRAANQEHEWKLASSLFLEQINPDLNGYTPMDSTLGSDGFLEMGLYAIAMNLGGDMFNNEDNFKAVRGVLQAVQEMSIVSPTDIEKYALAAASALGRSGRSTDFVKFVEKSSESLSDMGLELNAAILYSCFISKNYIGVVDLYKGITHARRSEDDSDWQWRGEYFSVHPLCDELLLRSLNECNLEELDESVKVIAISAFQRIVNQGGKISPDSILGVLRICGIDFDYNQALDVYQTVQEYNQANSDWRIINPHVHNFLSQAESEDESEMIIDSFKDRILAETMLVCNRSGQFGLSILCLLLSSDRLYFMKVDNMMISDHLLKCIPGMHSKPMLLNALQEALYGLQCFSDAEKLENKTTTDDYDSRDYAFNPAWYQAYLHIVRLLIASEDIRTCNVELTKKDILNISLATARMLRCTNACSQSSVGMYVINTILQALQSNGSSNRSIKDALKWILGFNTKDKGLETNNFFLVSDELLSAVIETEYLLHSHNNALNLFVQEIVEGGKHNVSGEGHGWTRSTNDAMKVFYNIDQMNDIKRVYDALQASKRNAETYLIMAKSLAKVRNWEGVAELYDHASGSGYVSEELCILAMRAVANSNLNGKLSVLRNLVHDIAKHRCRRRGMKSTTWVADHYWEIKEAIGFQLSRLLMSWNDRNEAQFNEARLACQHIIMKYGNGEYISLGAMKSILSYIQSDANDLNLVLDCIPGENMPKSCELVTWIILELIGRFEEDEEQNADKQEILRRCFKFLHRNGTGKEYQSVIEMLKQRGLSDVKERYIHTAVSKV